MGCDIHCYVEHRPREQKDDYDKHWRPFGGRINPGRNYDIFERLAGVRGEAAKAIAAPRGLPDDIAYEAKSDYWIWIDYRGNGEGEEMTVPDRAAGWVKSGRSVYRGTVTAYTESVGGVVTVTNAEHVGKPQYVSDPDSHTQSWVTPDEWEQAIEQSDSLWNVEYRALLAAMRSLETSGRQVRVVFWFDN